MPHGHALVMHACTFPVCLCVTLVFSLVFVILSFNKGVKHRHSLMWLITSHNIALSHERVSISVFILCSRCAHA